MNVDKLDTVTVSVDFFEAAFTLQEQNTALLEALERHIKMFDMVCDKVDFGNAFLDAHTISEWNEASIQATEAIRKASA